VMTLERRKITKSDPEYARLPATEKAQWEQHGWAFYAWVEQFIHVWLPGATTPETRLVWCSDGIDERTSHLDVLNDLGAQGWEAVLVRTSHTAMNPGVYGWDSVGTDIGSSILLKRQISDG
jgi:hypothetical protein